MKFSPINANRGHAALLFAMIVPVLFGVFTLGSDGARALQDKARLNEAMEVASLAVSAQDSDSATVRQQTATNFISYYFPQATVNNVTVSKVICDPGTCNSSITQRYFDYHVTASVSQKSWFPENETTAGFGESYDVASTSSARKFQSEAIDVVLVADFSASMYEYWDGDVNKRKFESVIEIAKEIADELGEYNSELSESSPKSSIGLAAFDFYTKTDLGYFSPNIFCQNYRTSSIRCNRRGCYYEYSSWKSTPDGMCWSENPVDPTLNTIDVSKTIEKVFLLSDPIHNRTWSDGDVTNISKYENIELTSNINTFKSQLDSTSDFYISASGGSGTASFTGVIKGAQLLESGTNNHRLLIILSDGEDSYLGSGNFSDALYNDSNNLCTSIKSHFEAPTDTDIELSMAVIGFDYEIEDYPQLANCVGDDNVYKAENRTEIKNRILSLITEEIGRLAND